MDRDQLFNSDTFDGHNIQDLNVNLAHENVLNSLLSQDPDLKKFFNEDHRNFRRFALIFARAGTLSRLMKVPRHHFNHYEKKGVTLASAEQLWKALHAHELAAPSGSAASGTSVGSGTSIGPAASKTNAAPAFSTIRNGPDDATIIGGSYHRPAVDHPGGNLLPIPPNNDDPVPKDTGQRAHLKSADMYIQSTNAVQFQSQLAKAPERREINPNHDVHVTETKEPGAVEASNLHNINAPKKTKAFDTAKTKSKTLASSVPAQTKKPDAQDKQGVKRDSNPNAESKATEAKRCKTEETKAFDPEKTKTSDLAMPGASPVSDPNADLKPNGDGLLIDHKCKKCQANLRLTTKRYNDLEAPKPGKYWTYELIERTENPNSEIPWSCDNSKCKTNYDSHVPAFWCSNRCNWCICQKCAQKK